MVEKFKLPDNNGWDSYADWMTDLGWIPNRHICIIIDDYKQFLKSDPEAKKIAMRIFTNNVLPFWEKDVLRVARNWETRLFKIYMVV